MQSAAASPRDDRIVGAVAAAAALGAGEVAGLVVPGGPSLVSGVATWVIDTVPGPVKDAVIAVFGTADKLVLGIGIVVVVIGLGAALGPVLVGRRGAAAGVFGLFALLGGLAAARTPSSTIVPSLAGGLVAAATGLVVVRRLPPGERDGGRRAFLRRSGLIAAGAIVAGVLGTVFAERLRPAAGELPVSVEPVAAPPPDLPAPGISPLVTPNDAFFRIDTVPFFPPSVDAGTWSLRLTGLVESDVSFTFDDILAMPLVERYITLSCVSNEVGGDLVGTARWLGVPLADIISAAGPLPSAEQVVARSVDGFTVGFPLDAVVDGREALLVVGMNGEPLPPEHGYPARLVVSGLYGYVSATKWVTELELTTWDAFDAYWVRRGWSKQAPVKTQSRIDTPRDGGRVAAGSVSVAGVAWAPGRGVDRVEVQVDSGPWLEAELSDPLSADAWRQWRIGWEATPGRHVLAVRATDGTGEVQVDKRLPPAPNGATGWHTITVEV